MIPLSEPSITGNEWKYIKECLDTGWVSSVGSYVNRFEEVLARYAGTKYAVACVNGTAALHASLIVCGIEPGDEVIVPTLTFIAPANTARYCQAYPIFMDSNDTLCMDVEKLADFLNTSTTQKKDGYTYNKESKRRIKAIIPVHVFGHPVDMEKLITLCKPRNIEIIEDATESLGSQYKGKKTGSFGTVGCFSFNGNKIITTGGGGMIVTNNEKLAARLKHLTTQARTSEFEYDHDGIGYNYRLTNIQAAMGVAQMERLDEFIARKRKNAPLYKTLLCNTPHVQFLWEKPWAKSNFWFYTVRVPKTHQRSLMNYLLSKKIQVRPLWKPIHTLPMYKKFQTYKIKEAQKAYETCINLPCSVTLMKKEIEFITECITRYFKKRTTYTLGSKDKARGSGGR